MKKIIIVLTVILVSCSKPNMQLNKNPLKIKIFNDTIYSKKKKYNNLGHLITGGKTNIIKFSIKNNSNQTLFVLPKNFYANRHNIIGIDNTVIKDKKNIVKPDIMIASIVWNECDLKKDKKIFDSRNKLGYYISSHAQFANEHTIIPPDNEIYFEVLLNIPFSSNVKITSIGRYKLDENKEYNFSLSFECDTLSYKKYLSKPLLKTIKENNYKLFHGTIESVNSIPIVFVDE